MKVIVMRNDHLFSVRKHSRIAAVCLVLLFSQLLISPGTAQTAETPDSLRFQALGCLYRSIQSLNSRNIRFKALQDELENMHPLEPQGMDSLHLATNLEKVSKYLLFLGTHRSQITKDVRAFSDSIHMFEKLVGKDEEKKALADFLKAYKEESASFIQYSKHLSTMLTNLRLAIVFLQTVPMERKGNDVSFKADVSANEKFMEFQSTIAADRMKVDEAIERSIRLTEKENKIIQETLTLFNK